MKKEPPRTPSILALSVQHFQRSRLTSLHPCLELLYAELSIPPFRQVSAKAITRQGVEDLLDLFPIRVSSEKRRLRCTGNIRLFRLANIYLPDDANVPCIIEDPLPENVLIRRAVSELIYAPACLGSHFSDVKILADIARRAIAAGRLAKPDRAIEAFLSDLYGVDRRQLKGKFTQEEENNSQPGKSVGNSLSKPNASDLVESAAPPNRQLASSVLLKQIRQQRTEVVIEVKRGRSTVGYYVLAENLPDNIDVARHRTATEELSAWLTLGELNLDEMLTAAGSENAAA